MDNRPQSHTPDTAASRRALRIKMLLGAAGLGALVVAGAPVAGLIDGRDGRAIAQNLSAPPAAPSPTALAPVSFADVVQRVKPAVVSIRVRTASGENGERQQIPGLQPGHPLERFFREFRGETERPGRPAPRRFGMSQGSGFFISADGYVVTNNHVVENGQDVSVVMDDGRTLKARIVGTDPKTDLALLKVEENGRFPFVTLEKNPPRIGDWVLAVGNPFGLGGTVTAGIVSAEGRDIGAGPYDNFIQIDAAVNRGNSGGPTFNLNGQVVGVNTAIASPSGGNVGIAFAISADTVERVVADLKANGTVDRGFLGVQIQPVTPDIAAGLGLDNAQGAIVSRVEADSPAARAGIRVGDAILSVNGKSVANARELSREIANLKPGVETAVRVWRDGRNRDVSVTLARLPGDQQQASARPQRGADQEAQEMGRLGLRLAPAESVAGIDKKGVLVVGVEPGSEAEQKGFRTGDVIVEIAGQAVTTPADVRRVIGDSRRDGRRAVLFRVETEDGARFVAIPTPPAG